MDMQIFQTTTCASTEQATEAFTDQVWRMTIFKDLLISQIWTRFHNYKKSNVFDTAVTWPPYIKLLKMKQLRFNPKKPMFSPVFFF